MENYLPLIGIVSDTAVLVAIVYMIITNRKEAKNNGNTRK